MWTTNTLYSFADFPSKKGQIISEHVWNEPAISLMLYGFDQGEELSEETIFSPMIYFVLKGEALLRVEDQVLRLNKEQYLYVPGSVARSFQAEEETITLMITFKEESMIQNLEKEQVLALEKEIPYEEGKIATKTLVRDDKLNMTLASFSGKQELSTHAAPGDALVLALDGDARIIIDGKEFMIHKGESIIMPGGIPHSVHVESTFKMLLIVSK